MIHLNIHEAKTHLSKYLAQLKRGQVIILCKRHVPVAELRALTACPTRKHLGKAKGKFMVTSDFFRPLTEDLLSAFEGHG